MLISRGARAIYAIGGPYMYARQISMYVNKSIHLLRIDERERGATSASRNRGNFHGIDVICRVRYEGRK